MFCDQRFDNLFKITPEDFIEFVQRQVDTVIGDPALGEIVGADALGPITTADQVTAVLGFFLFLLADLRFQQA